MKLTDIVIYIRNGIITKVNSDNPTAINITIIDEDVPNTDLNTYNIKRIGGKIAYVDSFSPGVLNEKDLEWISAQYIEEEFDYLDVDEPTLKGKLDD